MFSTSTASAAVLSLASLVLACPSPAQLGDISILAENDLITNNTATTSAALLLSKSQPLLGAQSACSDLGERLWSPHAQSFTAGLNSSLAYEVYAGRVTEDQLFWIAQNGKIPACRPSLKQCQAIAVNGSVYSADCNTNLPALCTQSAPASNISYANTSPPYQIQQNVGNQSLIGYRDFIGFRFLGVRFAAEPPRFTYSSLYDGTGVNDALMPPPQCLQNNANPNPLPTFNNQSDSTDCLFLNIWTTSLPADPQPAKKDLKAVMVYIHGGGFATGSASNPTNDGSELSSRGDVVVVDLQYRLSTLGFLALNDGVHNGNYWMSDVISGLEWVQKYITAFGGDPSRVTVFGESAGAETVQALLASPKATGLFSAALMQSNYLQPYQPIASSYNQTTLRILNATGCLSSSDQLGCLQAYNASALIRLRTTFNYPVIDGTYLTTSYINLNGSDCSSTINSVPILMGVNRDEEGVLAPIQRTTDLNTGITGAVGNATLSSAIIASNLFPLGSGPFPSNQTLNIFNTTTRILTDESFRCSNQFTAYAGVANGVLPSIYFYEFNRTYQDPGYNSNGVCIPAADATHPFGNPSAEYFKCHAGDLSNTFGTIARVGFPARDENDMPFAQLIVDYWTAFARSGGDPNPDMGYLQARGYWNTIGQIAVSGAWEPVSAEEGVSPGMMELQWNSFMRSFRDVEQCGVLGQGLMEYVE